MAKRTKSKKAAPPPAPVLRPPPKFAQPPRAFPWLMLLQGAILLAAGIWIYMPSLNGLWLWDDDFLIQQNAVVHDPQGLWYIWAQPSTLIDYMPLTVTAWWLEWQIWPDNPLALHITNLVLHLASALLVWQLFRKLGIRLAWLGAVLFTIHPANVESVAWMAELKNTLCMPPFLLTLLFWIDYERTRKPEYYVMALICFIIAMLCKQTPVMFPAIILLYAWWRHGWRGWRPFGWDVVQMLPFGVVSLATTCALIIYLRHGVGEQFIPLGGPLSRIACAGLSLLFYFSKAVLPLDLLPIYPQWDINPPHALQFLPWLVLGFGFWWLWRRRGEAWARHALFGFTYFFLNLLPFVGFRAISFMRFGWVMDHFLYVPMLGLIGLAAAAAGQLDGMLSPVTRVWRVAGAAVVLMALAIGAHAYDKIYVDRLALWTYTAQRNWMAWPAHNNRGNQLLENARDVETHANQLLQQADTARLGGYSDQARELTEQARVQMNLAQNLYAEAGKEFRIALALNPVYTEAHNNLGYVLTIEGHYHEAEGEFREALKYTPDFESAQSNLQRVLEMETAALKK